MCYCGLLLVLLGPGSFQVQVEKNAFGRLRELVVCAKDALESSVGVFNNRYGSSPVLRVHLNNPSCDDDVRRVGDGLRVLATQPLHDWESAVKPAYTEHKVALGHGVTCRCRNQRRVDGVDGVDRTQVYGTPKHVIDGKLVPDTESAWGAADWAEKLKSL